MESLKQQTRPEQQTGAPALSVSGSVAAQKIAVGDRITYADVNLRDHIGVLRAIGRQKNGGDCLVDWSSPRRLTAIVEWLPNLRAVQP